MAVTYIGDRAGSPRILYESAHFPDYRVLVFDPALEERPIEGVFDRLRRVDVVYFDADFVVVRAVSRRPPAALIETLARDSSIRGLLGGTPLAVLAPTVAPGVCEPPQLHPVHGCAPPGLDTPAGEFLRILREVEVHALLQDSGAVLESPGRHFALPSGMHTDRFVAFDRITRSPLAVQRLADWILSLVSMRTAVLTDQGALLPILLAVEVALERAFGRPLEKRILEEYPAEPSRVAEAVDDLLGRMPESSSLAFLLSVNSSGRLARFFRTMSPGDSRILAIIQSRQEEPTGSVEYLAKVPVRRYIVDQEGACELCSRRDTIGINPRTFERESKRTRTFIKLTPDRLLRKDRFWEFADKAAAVHLHYDDHRGRHHSVFLDTDALGTDPTFRQRCLQAATADPHLHPEVVVVPQHPFTSTVEKFTREAFGPNVPIVSIDCASGLGTDDLERAIGAAERILIVDDALITGQTINRIKYALYSLGRAQGRSLVVDCFVLLARPASKRQLAHLQNRFYDANGRHLRYGFTVLLPEPGASACVLCQERLLLERQRYRLTEQGRIWAQRRLRRLRSDVTCPVGFETDPFLTEGAFGGRLHRRTAFANYVGLAQEVRDEMIEKDRAGEILSLNPVEAIAKLYDAEFLGGLLRSLDRHRLWMAGLEEELGRLLESCPSDPPALAVIQELGWAAAQGRLPAAPVLRLMDRCPEREQLMLFRELIELSFLPERAAAG